MPLAMSQEHGNLLQTVQMLLKKNQVRELSVDEVQFFFTVNVEVCKTTDNSLEATVDFLKLQIVCYQ